MGGLRYRPVNEYDRTHGEYGGYDRNHDWHIVTTSRGLEVCVVHNRYQAINLCIICTEAG